MRPPPPPVAFTAPPLRQRSPSLVFLIVSQRGFSSVALAHNSRVQRCFFFSSPPPSCQTPYRCAMGSHIGLLTHTTCSGAARCTHTPKERCRETGVRTSVSTRGCRWTYSYVTTGLCADFCVSCAQYTALPSPPSSSVSSSIFPHSCTETFCVSFCGWAYLS